MFRVAKIKITSVTLITSYTNLATVKFVKHSSFQTLIHFTRTLRTLLIFRFVITSTANSDDLLGNMQLKPSFYDWRISILSSKKVSDANHLRAPLRKRKFSSTGSKGHCFSFVIGGFRSVL